MIIHAFITSRIDYCNWLFSLLNVSCSKPFAGHTKRCSPFTHQGKLTVSHRPHAHLHPLAPSSDRDTQNSPPTYTALHGEATAFVTDLRFHYTPARTLRSNGFGLRSVPRTCGDWAFEAVAPNCGMLGLHPHAWQILWTYSLSSSKRTFLNWCICKNPRPIPAFQLCFTLCILSCVCYLLAPFGHTVFFFSKLNCCPLWSWCVKNAL